MTDQTTTNEAAPSNFIHQIIDEQLLRLADVQHTGVILHFLVPFQNGGSLRLR